MRMLEISVGLAPQHEGSAVWDVTVMTSGVGIRYAVPDPVGLGPLHAVQDVLTHHLAPNDGRTVPGFSVFALEDTA